MRYPKPAKKQLEQTKSKNNKLDNTKNKQQTNKRHKLSGKMGGWVGGGDLSGKFVFVACLFVCFAKAVLVSFVCCFYCVFCFVGKHV